MEGQENSNSSRNLMNKLFVFILAVLFCCSIFLIIRHINIIKTEYSLVSSDEFRKKYLYKGLFHAVKNFFYSIIILETILLLINLPPIFISYTKYTFYYLNYIIFGPILFGSIILSMKYAEEITYSYDEKGNKFYDLNRTNMYQIFFFTILSFSLTIMGPIIDSYFYFIDSIKMKTYGNYFIGKIFWYIAVKFYRGIEEDNNIQVNNNNQNLVNLYDENDLLLENFY